MAMSIADSARDTAWSIVPSATALGTLTVVALILTLSRSPEVDESARMRVVRLLLAGIACQGVHFAEEFLTGFPARFPRQFGLSPLPTQSFVIFNSFWLVVWLLSAAGLLAGVRAALFPIWFLALGLMLNGVAHPLMAIAVGGYFPGLLTALPCGVVGAFLWFRLWRYTQTAKPGTPE